jgi:membrane fusion protein (multidrug efflux system)
MPSDDPKQPDQDKPADDHAQDDQEHPDRERQRKKTRPFIFIGLGIVVIVLLIVGIWYYLSTRNEITTDDAYTDGYATAMAPHVSGYVVSLDVRDNEYVHKGQALIHIDPRDYIAARNNALGQLEIAQAQLARLRFGAAIARKNFPARLAAAQAQLASAKATQFKAETDYRRQHGVAPGATTRQAVDNSTAALRSAQAQVRQAQAQVTEAEPVRQNIGQATAQVHQLQGTVKQAQAKVAQANLNLEWCVIRAPSDGWVTHRVVDRGAYVQSGQQLMSIVSPVIWVTANFKETQLTRMRPGQSVRIHVDSYPSLKLRGHIDSIQQGSGAQFSAFPSENATGNFVKIVRRVPVKIDLDSGFDQAKGLPLGISVEPTVNVK